MGIRPNRGDKVETNYRIDGRAEAQQLINESEHTGNEAGKVFTEISAQADSANKGTTELSQRVSALEKQLALEKESKKSIIFTATQGSPNGTSLVNAVFSTTTELTGGWKYRDDTNDILLLPSGSYLITVVVESTDPIRITHYRPGASGGNAEYLINPQNESLAARNVSIPLLNESSSHGIILRGVPTAPGRKHTVLVQNVN